MPQMGFEPTIAAFEWAKTVHALGRGATVIGSFTKLTGRICLRSKQTGLECHCTRPKKKHFFISLNIASLSAYTYYVLGYDKID
jgi:hypothetical protein